MDLDSFVAVPKWDILKIIAQNPSSPIEIAEITKTTVSYVSQQLKLLEAFGIVEKTKTGAFEKGKPRNIYSVKEDFVYFTVLAKNFSYKKKLVLDYHNLIVLNIWFLENRDFHLPLEKFFVQIDDLLPNVRAVYLDESYKTISLKIICDDKFQSKIKSEIKKTDLDIHLNFISESDLNDSIVSSYYALFDPFGILKTERDKLKGGILK